MKGTSIRLAAVIAAALAGSGVGVVVANDGRPEARQPSAKQEPAQRVNTVVTQGAVAADWWAHNRSSNRVGYRSGPGWTIRQVKRAALKKRNQARHRKACRG